MGTPSTASCGARRAGSAGAGPVRRHGQLSDPAPGLCPAAGRGGHRLSGVQTPSGRCCPPSRTTATTARSFPSTAGPPSPGGFNLADEYINAIEKHGHWKVAGICLRGDAAWGLTLMFLQMWGMASRAGDELAASPPAPPRRAERASSSPTPTAR